MRKRKFYFNPEDLTYVIYKPRNWERVLKIGGIFASVSLMVLLAYSVYLYQTRTPEEKKLSQQLGLYKKQLQVLNGKIHDFQAHLDGLQQKDNQIYRVIFEADPLPDDIYNAGIGGTDAYTDLSLQLGAASLVETHKKIDNLMAKSNVLAQSYTDLVKMAKSKEQMLASIPAIQPISNQRLNRIASGYGNRIHPIYKTLKMHAGIDFTAPKGTPVYATGDGVVEKIGYDGRGYGNHVIINHGFGYKTVYAHLSKCEVKRRQKVKRGEVIGKVGSTGLSTAPHLHYEVMKGGRKINPINYFHNDLKAEEYNQIIKLANQSNQSFD